MTDTSGIQCQDKPGKYYKNKSFRVLCEKSRSHGDLRHRQTQGEKRGQTALPGGSSFEALLCQNGHLPKLAKGGGDRYWPANPCPRSLKGFVQLTHHNHLWLTKLKAILQSKLRLGGISELQK